MDKTLPMSLAPMNKRFADNADTLGEGERSDELVNFGRNISIGALTRRERSKCEERATVVFPHLSNTDINTGAASGFFPLLMSLLATYFKHILAIGHTGANKA